jgi:hypothetical protein
MQLKAMDSDLQDGKDVFGFVPLLNFLFYTVLLPYVDFHLLSKMKVAFHYLKTLEKFESHQQGSEKVVEGGAHQTTRSIL